MKRRIVTGLAAALMAGVMAAPALAQGPGAEGRGRMGGQMPAERMQEVLFEGITLTADQQGRAKAVHETFAPRVQTMRERMMAARQAGQQPGPEGMQAMRALNLEYRDSLRAVLTAEQQVIFDRNAQQMMQRRPPGERQRAAAWRDRGERRGRTRI